MVWVSWLSMAGGTTGVYAGRKPGLSRYLDFIATLLYEQSGALFGDM